MISQGSQFGLGTWLMKYSREYEKQADLVGAQIMARAGYDPRDLARMFETIQKQGGGGAPQWLSSHPNPGNRTQYINAEAAQLRIAPRAKRLWLSANTQPACVAGAGAHDGGPRTHAATTGGDEPRAGVGRARRRCRCRAPSRQYRTVQGGELFQVSVPTNWTPLSSNNSVKFVPQNGYGEANGQETMTHGVELGVARASSRDLRQATQTLIDGFVRSNHEHARRRPAAPNVARRAARRS